MRVEGFHALHNRPGFWRMRFAAVIGSTCEISFAAAFKDSITAGFGLTGKRWRTAMTLIAATAMPLTSKMGTATTRVPLTVTPSEQMIALGSGRVHVFDDSAGS